MSTAEDLLNGESSKYLEIDSDLRTIKIPTGFKILGVYNDKDVKRLYFRLNRFYNDIDLSEYNVSVNYKNGDNETKRFFVVDNRATYDRIEFSWLVGKHAFLKKGYTLFNICLRKLDDDGNIISEFNTTVHKLQVLEGLEATVEQPTEDEKDYVQQFLNEMQHKFEIDYIQKSQERADAFDEAQTRRANEFTDDQMARTYDFNASQNERNRIFIASQNERSETFTNFQNEKAQEFVNSQNERANEFTRVMAVNKKAFDDAQADRAETFESSENSRQTQYSNKINAWKSQVDEISYAAFEAVGKANDASKTVLNTAEELKQRVEAGEFNGKPFTFDYIVPNANAFASMQSSKLGDFAIVSSNIEDPDNSTIWCFMDADWVPEEGDRHVGRWKYLNDFSGTIGVGVASIIQTQASSVSEGVNVWTATLTNGDKFTFQVRNGERGEAGYSGVYVGEADTTPPDTANVWVIPDGEPTPIVNDVLINGTSITRNGAADIPIATRDRLGVLRPRDGLFVNAEGTVVVDFASEGAVDTRASGRAIGANRIDYAVKAALTDGKGAEWSASEQQAAQARLGIFNVSGVEF